MIAGSDSSGGAGLEADQKVIAVHGCYAMTATTALTAQNTQGVYGIHETPSEFVKKQIDACIEDVGVDVVKTGMLASASTIEVVAEAFRKHKVSLSVVDPVMASTSGAQLLQENAINTLCRQVLPLTTLLTPNIPEAKLLLENSGISFKEPEDVEDVIAIAKAVQKLGPKYVLLKGGHLPLTKNRLVSKEEADRNIVLNVLHGDGQTILMETDYLNSRNTHGTGCSLASAIACNLANGADMVRAVKKANHYVEAGIKFSKDLGRGSGPINHFHSTYTLPFAPGRFIEYLLDRDDVRGPWRDHTEHEFVQRLANGTLPLQVFRHYLIQDYLFLIHFARANALAAYKAKSLEDITRSAENVAHIQEELKLHLEYCKDFSISIDEIEKHEESQACTAYTRYVLDIGQSEDWLGLQVALLPCLIGYGMIARRLYDDPKTVHEGNIYWKWVETYVAEDYTEAMRNSSGSCFHKLQIKANHKEDLVEKEAVKQSVSRIDELAKIFIHATRMEAGFWDMGSSGA